MRSQPLTVTELRAALSDTPSREQTTAEIRREIVTFKTQAEADLFNAMRDDLVSELTKEPTQ